MNVLLLEDDKSLGATLKSRLEKEGLTAHWVSTIQDAKQLVDEQTFQLIILDVGLPDGSGFAFSKYVRQKTNCPFIFVTAQTSAEDRLQGYELGAVEFIPKPFHLKEFLIRVKNTIQLHGSDEFVMDDLKVNFNTLTVEINGQSSEFNLKEAAVLKMLINLSPKVVSRDQLLDHVWGEDQFPSQRTVDNVIVSLRQKLGSYSVLIHSVRGVGYVFKKN